MELENEKLFKVTKILNRGQGPAREGCRGRKKKVGRNDTTVRRNTEHKTVRSSAVRHCWGLRS